VIRALARANALPETALVVSLSLLLLFGAVQEALFGFDQIAADGATFMGAQKSVQLKGSSASLADARAVVGMLFPRVKSSNVTIATSSSGQPLFETDVSQQVSSLHLPGVQMPAQVTIQSRDVEVGVASSAASNAGIPGLCYALTTGSTFNTGLSSVLNSATGTLNSAALTQHVTDVTNLGTTVGKLPTDLTNIVTDLVNILNIPVLGNIIGSVIGMTAGTAGTVVSGLVQPVLNAALSGSATSAQLTGLLGSVLGEVRLVLGLLNPNFLALNTAITTLQTDLTTLNTVEGNLASGANGEPAKTGSSGC